MRLQKYRDGHLSDAKMFAMKEDLSWVDTSGKTWTVIDLRDWKGQRAQAGRLPPKGFSKEQQVRAGVLRVEVATLAHCLGRA